MSKIKNLGFMRKNTIYSRNSDDFHNSLPRPKEYQITNNPNLEKF